MKQTRETPASFAFRLAETRDPPRQDAWQVRSDVAVAGCTGIDTRASVYPGRDNGLYC
jgi:hypothetical protein